MTTDSTTLRSGYQVLARGIENETLCFEARVYGKPFLPRDKVESYRLFCRHCQDIDAYLNPDRANTQRPALKHFCWMSTPTQDSTKELIFLEYEEDASEHRPQTERPRDAANLFGEQVRVLLEHQRLNPLFRMVASPRVFPDAPFFILSAYVVFVTQRITRLLPDGPAINFEDFLKHCRSTPTGWPDDFIYCTSVLIPGPADRKGAKEGLDDIEKWLQRPEAMIQFQSYHVIVPSKDCDPELYRDVTRLSVLRLQTMQFQREWANREREIEARMDIEQKRREGLLTVAHEFKNALDHTKWFGLLSSLQARKLQYTQIETQQSIERCLSLLLWPQSLGVVIRALAKAELGVRLRQSWLANQAEREFDSYKVLGVYQESIRYLVHFVCRTFSPKPDLLRLVEICTADASGVGLRHLSERTVCPQNEPFDAHKLVFPPLTHEDTDEFAPVFTVACLIIEPLRNAIRYVEQNRAALGRMGFIAWSVSAGNDFIEVELINPLVSQAEQLSKKGSTQLVSSLGKSLDIGDVVGPTKLDDRDKKPYARVLIRITPHLLRDQIGDPT